MVLGPHLLCLSPKSQSSQGLRRRGAGREGAESPVGQTRSQGLQSSLNTAFDSFSRYKLSSSRKL